MAEHTDPDQIEREIERTRAELAETIDAIAERVSPKRVAVRTADRVRQAVKGDSRPRLRAGAPETGETVTTPVDGEPGTTATLADRHERNARSTGLPGTGNLYVVRKELRVERVVLVAGVVVALIGTVLLVRRRRSR